MTNLQIRFYSSRDGLALAYRESSIEDTTESGLPIMCIPGMTRNSRDFTAFAARFSQTHRVLLPDLRGRGASAWSPDPLDYRHAVYVDDLRGLLDHCDTGPAVVVGTSLGGVLALRLAAAEPDRVAGIVLNDIGPGAVGSDTKGILNFLHTYAPVDSWEDAIDVCRTRFGTTYPDWNTDDWPSLAHALYAESEDGNILPDYDPDIAVPFERNRADTNNDLWDVFKSLTNLPMLAVRGQRSAVLTLDLLDTMRREHPNLRIAEVADVGHAPTLVETAAITAITSFLDEIGQS